MVSFISLLFFLCYFLYSLKKTGNVSLAFLTVLLVCVFFNRNLSFFGIKYLTTGTYVCLCYILLIIIRHDTDPFGKSFFSLFSIYLLLLIIWSVLNGTLFSEGMMLGFKRMLAWFSLALYGCFTLKSKKDFLCIIDLLSPFLYIMTIYGVYCYMSQSNPVMDGILSASGVDDNMLSHFSQESRGGLTGRIQGFTSHPLVYSGELLMAFFLFLYRMDLRELYRTRDIALLFLVLLNILMTGCRSAIIGLFVGLISYLFLPSPNARLKKSIKNVVLIFVVVPFISASFIDEYRDFINSIIFFWQDNEETVSGSSMSLRIGQLISSFGLISSDLTIFLFGLGHNWCNMYSLSHNGMHPDLYGFESIIFVGLIEFGVIGFFLLTLGLYFIYIYEYMRYAKSSLILAVIIAYLTFQIFTGEYSTDHFLIFTLLMLKNSYYQMQSQISNKNT